MKEKETGALVVTKDQVDTRQSFKLRSKNEMIVNDDRS